MLKPNIFEVNFPMTNPLEKIRRNGKNQEKPTWLENLRRYFLFPRRPIDFGNGNFGLLFGSGAAAPATEPPSASFFGFA
jgi:hypothetical protein